MKKTLKLIMLISTILLFAGCSNPASNSLIGATVSNYPITGTVEFPENPSSVTPNIPLNPSSKEEVKENLSPIHNSSSIIHNFSTKATLAQVGVAATVSLIYPFGHANSNKTIATGLTSATGAFTINPSVSFNPQANDIYILEASKRIGDVGNEFLTVRTYLKWTGSSWLSITTPGISVNSRTTAVTIITDYDSSVAPSDTIGKIDVSTGTSVINQNIGNVTPAQVFALADKVTMALAEDRDPFHIIRYINNEFVINKDQDIGKLISSGSCEGCYLNDIDLSQFDLKGVNLSYSVLKGKDLSNLDFSGAILLKANLQDTNLTNTIFSDADLYGALLTGATLKNNDFTGADLAYASFTDSVIENPVFVGANLNNTDFSKVTFTMLENAGLRDAWLENTNFSETNLENLDFSELTLTGINFTKTNLSNVSFYKTKLSSANFSEANLDNTNFEEAILNGAKFSNKSNFDLMKNVFFNLTSFINSDLSQVIFSKEINGNLEALNLSYSILDNTVFTGAQLSNLDLTYTSFINTDFSGLNLSNSDFSKSTFFDSYFNGSDITGTVFDEAYLNNVTWTDNTFHENKYCSTGSTGSCN